MNLFAFAAATLATVRRKEGVEGSVVLLFCWAQLDISSILIY